MTIASSVSVDTKLHMLQCAFPAEDIYKIALFNSEPDVNYTGSGEITGKGYQAGGKVLAGYICGTSGTLAYLNFASPTWHNCTLSASYAQIYNSSSDDVVVVTLEFDETTVKNGMFTVEFPANGPAALLSL
jgi:hypothetical protein